jgi:hypothetical protein
MLCQVKSGCQVSSGYVTLGQFRLGSFMLGQVTSV